MEERHEGILGVTLPRNLPPIGLPAVGGLPQHHKMYLR